MILGIDHLALSVSDLNTEKEKLEVCGYDCKFVEDNLPNNIGKKNYLHYFQTKHSVALFTSKNSYLSIELTNHGRIYKNNAPLNYITGQLILNVSDLPTEYMFWQNAMSFNAINENTVSLSRPLKQWSCDLKLIQTNTLETKPMLDDKGFTCLAFLSSNLEDDLKTVVSHGAHSVVGPFPIQVNRKTLEVSLFRTPTGVICELIAIQSQKN